MRFMLVLFGILSMSAGVRALDFDTGSDVPESVFADFDTGMELSAVDFDTAALSIRQSLEQASAKVDKIVEKIQSQSTHRQSSDQPNCGLMSTGDGVIVYTHSGFTESNPCIPCERLKTWMTSNGIAYTMQTRDTFPNYPVVEYRGNRIVGFKSNLLLDLLSAVPRMENSFGQTSTPIQLSTSVPMLMQNSFFGATSCSTGNCR